MERQEVGWREKKGWEGDLDAPPGSSLRKRQAGIGKGGRQREPILESGTGQGLEMRL